MVAVILFLRAALEIFWLPYHSPFDNFLRPFVTVVTAAIAVCIATCPPVPFELCTAAAPMMGLGALFVIGGALLLVWWGVAHYREWHRQRMLLRKAGWWRSGARGTS